MAKLGAFGKRESKIFKKEVKGMGGSFTYDKESGLSMLQIPHDDMNGFMQVYVAYCSKKDKFSKKYARMILRDRYYDSQYILVPVGKTLFIVC